MDIVEVGMKTGIVEDGLESSDIEMPGSWYYITSAELIMKDVEITEWLRGRFAGETINYCDQGRLYFEFEKDRTMFLLKWA